MLEFNNWGNVDTVTEDMGLEGASEEFETIGPCCAKAEVKRQTCGVKPKLSSLMMSAA